MGAAAPLVVVANPTAGRGAAGRRIGAVDSLRAGTLMRERRQIYEQVTELIQMIKSSD